MKTIKRFETRVNIKNPILFHTDDTALITLLEEKFAGKCWMGCLVLTIEQIIRQSKCMIVDTIGTIDVIFEASVIVYTAGDIITGCVVKSSAPIENIVNIIAESEHCSLVVSSGLLKSIKSGQIIPLQVGRCRYKINEPRVNVHAEPVDTSSTCMWYRVHDEPLDIPVVEKFMAEAVANPPEQTRGWKYFDDLLYHGDANLGADLLGVCKELIATASPAGAKKYAYLGVDIRYRISAGRIGAIPTGGAPPVDAKGVPCVLSEVANPTNVVVNLLTAYIKATTCIREMINVYNTPAILDAHKNLWLIMKHVKTNK